MDIETLQAKLNRLARDIGTVHDVATRRSDPDHDTQLMLARLSQWRRTVLEISTSTILAQPVPPDLRGLVEKCEQADRAIDGVELFTMGVESARLVVKLKAATQNLCAALEAALVAQKP